MYISCMYNQNLICCDILQTFAAFSYIVTFWYKSQTEYISVTLHYCIIMQQKDVYVYCNASMTLFKVFNWSPMYFPYTNVNHLMREYLGSQWKIMCVFFSLQWRQNGRDSVSNHQPRECLLSRLIRHISKKTSKLRVTGLCVGNSPGPMNSPHEGPVARKMFPFDDVIMLWTKWSALHHVDVWQHQYKPGLTHWGRDKMVAVSQTTLSNAFSWMKMSEFRLRLHLSLFLRVQLTII